jgi:DNA-binding NtrC family response regulator
MRKPQKLLIADANQNRAQSLLLLLAQGGYSVSITDSLKKTMYQIQKEKIDVLVMDVEMPEMKGYEAVPIICGIDPEIRIILTAENNSPELEAKVRQQKVFYYHVNTFGNDELMLAIRNACERATHQR